MTFFRHEDVVEDELRRVGAMGCELLQPAARLKPGRLGIEQEEIDRARALSWVDRGRDGDEIGHDRVRGEHLRALQAVAAFHFRSPRPDCCGIRTRVGLRNGEGADLSALDGGHKIPLPQFLPTPFEDRVGRS